MRSAPNDGRKAGGVLAFGIAMSMSAMTYKLERFRAKWAPVRVKKTRQNKKLEPGSDYIRTEKAPDIPATPAARDRLSVRPDTPSFQRPGADVLNEAIPAFFIGRNHSGFWVARDANGLKLPGPDIARDQASMQSFCLPSEDFDRLGGLQARNESGGRIENAGRIAGDVCIDRACFA